MKPTRQIRRKTYSAKQFLRFVLPSTASMLVFSTYTIVDGAFVAHGVGELALGAVNLCMPFINCMFAVAVLLSVGTSTVCAVHLGHGDEDAANRIFTQNAFVVGGIALLLTLAVQLFPGAIAELLGATAGTRAYMISYLRIISAFSACFMVSYCFEVLVKTGGHPSLSIIGVCTCSLANIVLDYVFVIRLGMGIEGAALATGIAQAASFLIFLLHFLRGRSDIRFKLSRPFLRVYRRILPLGFSDFSAEFALGLTALLFNHTLRAYVGEMGIVAYSLVGYVNTFALMVMTGITQGMQPLVSLSLGRGDKDACDGYFRYALYGVAGAAALCFAACRLFPEAICALLLDRTSPTFGYAAVSLRSFSWVFLPVGFNLVGAGFFTATERPLPAMAISLTRGFFAMALSLFALTALFGGAGIWWAPPVGETLCLALTAALLLTHRRRTGLRA